MPNESPVVTVADVERWRAWLDEHESTSDGIWLVLAKKGTQKPTSLRYQEALLEALCSGWIDGQMKPIDTATYMQRFTPRRARSMWSARNVTLVAQLEREGRIRSRGREEVAKAKADGRWERAYAGSADAEVPPDLTAALHAAGAGQAFEALSRAERYSILHPIMTAASPQTRERRIVRAVDRLAITGSPGAENP